MSKTNSFVLDIDKMVGSGLLVVGAVEVMNRYNRLSRLLEGLHRGRYEEFLNLLSC